MSKVSQRDIDRAVEWVRTTKARGSFQLLFAYPDPHSPTTICVRFNDDEDHDVLWPVHLEELDLPEDRPPSALPNRQLLERIMRDLNYMIDVQGNTQLIPALVLVKENLDAVRDMQMMLQAMKAADADEEEDVDEEPYVCYMGHENCWDDHTNERLADEADWEQEREDG